MYTININEEHINNIEQMIDGIIPQKFQKTTIQLSINLMCINIMIFAQKLIY